MSRLNQTWWSLLSLQDKIGSVLSQPRQRSGPGSPGSGRVLSGLGRVPPASGASLQKLGTWPAESDRIGPNSIESDPMNPAKRPLATHRRLRQRPNPDRSPPTPQPRTPDAITHASCGFRDSFPGTPGANVTSKLSELCASPAGDMLFSNLLTCCNTSRGRTCTKSRRRALE